MMREVDTVEERAGFPDAAEQKRMCEAALAIARRELYEAHLQVVAAKGRGSENDIKAWETERERRRRKVLALEDELKLIDSTK